MQLPSKIEYSLIALLELTSAYYQGQSRRLNEIANKQGIPERYLEQILTSLRQNNIVQSQRGAKGGYMLARHPRQIILFEVIQALSHDDSAKNFQNSEINLERQLLREVMQEADDASQTVLKHYSLEDLYQKRETNPMYYI